MVKVLQQNTWIDDRKFLKSYVQARAELDNINHPAYGTWTADFKLRQNKIRAFLGKYLTRNDPRVPWRHKRREMKAIAEIIPVAKWLAKIKQQSDIGWRSCKRVREQGAASTANLPEETYRLTHKECFLRWNGDNHHGCPPLHLETSVCQHVSCTNTSE